MVVGVGSSVPYYSFGSEGSQPEKFNSPEQMDIAQDGLVYVSDHENSCVQVFQQDACLVQQFGNNVIEYSNGLGLTYTRWLYCSN